LQCKVNTDKEPIGSIVIRCLVRFMNNRQQTCAIEEDVPAPVITLSLQMRFRSRQDDSFAAKVIAALRHEFGGHAVQKESSSQAET